MPSTTDIRPLLQPQDFTGRRTKYGRKGFLFNYKIDESSREHEVFNMARRDCDEFLDGIVKLRPYTKIVLNPNAPSAISLLEFFASDAEKHNIDDDVNIHYGLPKKYDLHWRRIIRDDFDSEGQYLVLVAFSVNREEPVGYLGLKPWINHDPDERELLLLNFDLKLIYVRPIHRGLGYGMDLSIACGYVCQDILTATYRAVSPGTTITPIIWADYESFGGEDCALQVNSILEYCVDTLLEIGHRESVQIDNVVLDAGF